MTYENLILYFVISVAIIMGFVLCCILALKRNLKKSEEPVIILRDMVEWRLRYYDARNNGALTAFGNIDRYLFRTSHIVKIIILNHDNNFEHVKLKEVKVKDISNEFGGIIKEFRECDENIRTLFFEMNELLNRIANYKNPIRYRCLLF